MPLSIAPVRQIYGSARELHLLAGKDARYNKHVDMVELMHIAAFGPGSFLLFLCMAYCLVVIIDMCLNLTRACSNTPAPSTGRAHTRRLPRGARQRRSAAAPAFHRSISPASTAGNCSIRKRRRHNQQMHGGS